MLISNLVKMLPKNWCEKVINEKGQKNWVFDFYYFVQKVLACNFLGDILHFFKRIPTQHRIIQIEFLKKKKIILLELIAD